MDYLILLVLNFLLNNNVGDEFCIGIFIIIKKKFYLFIKKWDL
jgi:hypothetical protein